MSKYPTPVCCEYARNFIELSYEIYYTDDKDHFLKNKPFWTVRGTEFQYESGRYAEPKEYKIFWCPFCRQKLPDIKLKDTIPEKVMTMTDGGYYCDTCSQRLNECRCNRPESMWEII